MKESISVERYLYVHRTRIHPNNKQKGWLKGCAGFRRVAYNWALSAINDVWNEGGRLSTYDADKAFNAIKKEEYPWSYEYPSCVGQMAIKYDLKSAFDGFYRRVKAGGTPGFPRFKSRFRGGDSLTFSNVVVKDQQIQGKRLVLPKKMGTIRMGDAPRYQGRLLSTSISRQGTSWYAAFLFELPERLDLPIAGMGAVGIDLGIAATATMSNGEPTMHHPAEMKRLTERKKWLQRKLSKLQGPDKRTNQKASKSWLALNARINQVSRKIADIRSNSSHQLTARLAKRYSVIVVEDLKLKNMSKSAKGSAEEPGKNVAAKSGLNRELLNIAAFEIRRQLEYKTERHHGVLIAVNAAYTSQTCHECGHVAKENRTTQSLFICVLCGHTDNADKNAANNILQRGLNELAGSPAPVGLGSVNDGGDAVQLGRSMNPLVSTA